MPQLDPSSSVMCSTAGPDRDRKWETKNKDGSMGRGVLQWLVLGWDSVFTYQGMKQRSQTPKRFGDEDISAWKGHEDY